MAFLLILTLAQAWNTGPRMPTPRHAFATGQVGNRIFAIGGLGEHMHRTRAEVEAYDVDGDSWMTGFAPMPWPRAYAACAVLDGKIYVIGGSDMRMETRRVDRFDPAANRWDTVASLPWPAQAMGATVFRNHIYAVGGYSFYNEGRYLKNALRYVPSPGPGRWEEVDSMHVPRAGLGLAVAGDSMYAVGGKFFNHLATAEHYTFNRWDTVPMQMRFPRSEFPAVGYAHHICAIGGQGPSMRTGSVELFSTFTGQWIEVEPLPTGRMGHGAAVVRDSIYVIGGRDMEGLAGEVLSHQVFIVGIEEPGEEPFRQQAAHATVTRGRLRVEATGSWYVFDNTGKRVATGRGASEVSLLPGVYFVHPDGPESGTPPSRVTILK